MPSSLPESTVYENFVEQTKSLSPIEPPPPKHTTDYPHVLKVHLLTKDACHAFARVVRRTLSTDRKRLTFAQASTTKSKNWVFIEKRTKAKVKRRKKSSDRNEANLYGGTTDFVNNEVRPYMTFELVFRSEKQYVAFARRVKQRLSLASSYMYYPMKEQNGRPEYTQFKWRSTFPDPNPRYPVYIVSKGRADTRLTSKSLERMGVPYYIVVEPQDKGDYACWIDESKILVTPFSNHGDGPGRARNWCWDHAKEVVGAKRHWVLDDNIDGFYRLHNNQKIEMADGGCFRVAEDFVDRFSNIPVAGFAYNFFVVPNSSYPPFILNTRIYSCLLIDNACPYRWRARYNEDTDQSLRVLKDGQCTLQFYEFLQGKVATQAMQGGNTAEFYAVEGTWNKSVMLEQMHPDVAKVVYRYGRWHHEVNYRPFSKNTPRPIKNTGKATQYTFALERISGPK